MNPTIELNSSPPSRDYVRMASKKQNENKNYTFNTYSRLLRRFLITLYFLYIGQFPSKNSPSKSKSSKTVQHLQG